MSSSPEFRPSAVLKGAATSGAAPVGFVTDLRGAATGGRPGRAPVAVPGESGWRSATAADLAVEVREAAHAQGYAAGWAEGRRLAAADAEARAAVVAAEAAAAEELRCRRHESAMVALAAAAGTLERRTVPVLDEFADSILAAAMALAEAALGRELALAGDGGAAALRRALDMAPRQRPVTVRLHPDDLATLAVAGSTTEIDGRTVTLVPDASVGRGGALAESDATEVDARLATALDRARKALQP
jgi:flagellar assembly protein FliH